MKEKQMTNESHPHCVALVKIMSINDWLRDDVLEELWALRIPGLTGSPASEAKLNERIQVFPVACIIVIPSYEL